MTTAITTAGSYPAGDYHLANDITVNGVNGITFTGIATLDLNGKKLIDQATGDTVTYGVKSIYQLTLTDRLASGQITGFWSGVKVEGAGSFILGVDFSGCRYIGIQAVGDDIRVNGCKANDLAGVTADAYAIGVNCTGARPIVENCSFRNLYRQAGYVGTAAGEGLAVNFAATSTDGVCRNVDMVNDDFEKDTIGVFVGAGGGHTVEWIRTHNVQKPVQRDPSGPTSIIRQVAASYAHNASLPAPPNGTAPILSETLDSHFGNIETKTARVQIVASALTVPTGTPTKIRLKLVGHADEAFSVGSLYIGHKAASGDAWDAASLAQLLVGGVGNFVVPQGGEVWTDWLTWGWDKTTDLIVSLYCDGGTTTDKMAAKTGTAHATYLNGGDVAGTADTTGFTTYAGYLSAVAEIQTDGF